LRELGSSVARAQAKASPKVFVYVTNRRVNLLFELYKQLASSLVRYASRAVAWRGQRGGGRLTGRRHDARHLRRRRATRRTRRLRRLDSTKFESGLCGLHARRVRHPQQTHPKAHRARSHHRHEPRLPLQWSVFGYSGWWRGGCRRFEWGARGAGATRRLRRR